jgi:tRNA (guanine-N7-)-methyltransferase
MVNLSLTLALALFPFASPLPFPLNRPVPEHTKVMGKEWADARRQANVDRLGVILAAALDGRTSLTFELGCGHGHWLAAYGAAHPDEFCVGIDLITHRVERSVRKQTLGKLDNVLFLKAEATEFLDALPSTVILRKIFILYPDPWPKKKHHKNRFINAENLARLAAHAVAGARLHFRTDDADYHAWTHDHLAAHPAWRLAADVPWPFERTTFFEERMQDKRDLVADRAEATSLNCDGLSA